MRNSCSILDLGPLPLGIPMVNHIKSYLTAFGPSSLILCSLAGSDREREFPAELLKSLEGLGFSGEQGLCHFIIAFPLQSFKHHGCWGGLRAFQPIWFSIQL